MSPIAAGLLLFLVHVALGDNMIQYMIDRAHLITNIRLDIIAPLNKSKLVMYILRRQENSVNANVNWLLSSSSGLSS